MNGRSDAIVIGGGWAGVAAALALADGGARVTLLESRRLWGGRATSWPDPKHGDVVDNGQHVLLGCYAATRALLARLGTAPHVAFADGLDLSFRELGGQASRLVAPGVLGRAGLLLGLAGWTRVPLGERIALARAIHGAAPPAAHLTVDAWLDGLSQGPAARRFFWTPLTEAVVNETPARAPASLLHAAIVRAFRGPAHGAALGLATTGLAALVAPVVDALAARRGLALLGHTVAEVASDPAGGHVVRLEDGRAFAAPRVVLAVPAAEARALVAEAYPRVAAALAPAADVPAAPIVTATLWFERPPLPSRVVGLVAPPSGGGPGFHFVFDRASLLGATASGHAVTLVASAARGLIALPTAQIVERARAALAAYRLTTETPLSSRVVKEPRATPAWTPETINARPPVATGVPGLAVAGDWTASPLPATLEAAVLSGRAAADHVLAKEGTG